jgi:hypothetical protein
MPDLETPNSSCLFTKFASHLGSVPVLKTDLLPGLVPHWARHFTHFAFESGPKMGIFLKIAQPWSPARSLQ